MTKEKKGKCVQVLLPALVNTPELKQMTDDCRKSIVSFDHCIKLTEDNNKYPRKVAQAWNTLLDPWRGKEYDFLMIMASDTILDPMAIDYVVKCMEENPSAGVVTLRVERDLEKFKAGFGQQKYSGKLCPNYHDLDPANFLIRKGVIETVGRIDEMFPGPFVERDFWRRCNLAGFDWIQPVEVLNYHPPHAGTIGNDQKELQAALRKYMLKWGGDAGQERFEHPYNDMRLSFTYTGLYRS